MALLAACSSGSGTNSEPLEISSNSSSGADLFAETFDDLPVGTVNREGAIAYVKDEKAAYACEGGDWTLDDEDSTERKSLVTTTSPALQKNRNLAFLKNRTPALPKLWRALPQAFPAAAATPAFMTPIRTP